MMNTDKHRLTLIFELFLIAAVVLISYSGIFRNDFVYDDLVIVANNPHIHNLKNLPKIFTTDYFNISGERTYRPITTLTYFLDAAVWKNNPIGFHITSIVLHLAACLLLFFLARFFTRGDFPALAASLLFASHPLVSEAVIGITFREDLLAAVFSIAALLAYLQWRNAGSKNLLVISWFLYLLSIFSKESAAALPLIILALEFIPSVNSPLRTTHRAPRTSILSRIFTPQIGYAIAAILFLLIYFLGLKGAAHLGNFPGTNFTATLSIMIQTFGKYLTLFFYPSGLCLDYIPAKVAPFVSRVFLLPAFTITALLVSAFSARRRMPAYFVGIIIFFVHLIPVSNLVPFGAVVANRYMYLPATGLCLACAAILQLIFIKTSAPRTSHLAPRTILFFACIVVIISFLSWKTIKQGSVWLSGETLWADTVRCCPASARAHTNYGIALRENGKPEQAVEELLQAVALDPHYEALNALGAAWSDLHQWDAAVEAYRCAAAVNPASPFPAYNAGIAMMNKKSYESAIRWFMEASRIAPQWAPPIYNAGNIYLKTGKPELAAAFYQKALRLDPNNINARGNLAVAYLQMGKTNLAEQQLNILLRLDPSNTLANYYLNKIRRVHHR